MTADATRGSGERDSRPVRPSAQDILDTFGRARPVTIANAARIPGSTVRVTGRAVAGPAGPVRAPLSGVECVWYRSMVLRHVRATRLNPGRPLQPFPAIAPSDLPYEGMTSTYGLSGQHVGSDRSSGVAFGLDDGTGVVTVDPGVGDMDSNVFAINTVVQVEDPARDTNALGFGGGAFDHQELHTEWIIPVGAPLLAVGTVAAGAAGAPPALVPGGQDVLLVSTKPEQQILSRNHAAVDPGATHLPIRSARAVYAIIGGLLAVAVALAAVVLLVLH